MKDAIARFLRFAAARRQETPATAPAPPAPAEPAVHARRRRRRLRQLSDRPLLWLFGLERLGMKFGLENMRALAAELGEPQRRFRSVHIAGTNGKGSVTAMVDTALRTAGVRSARYTSPHLVRLEERFVIDGRAVETAALEASVARVREAVDRLLSSGALAAPATFFECATAAAFDLFAGAGVEIAVLEVGLGGRLDATNIVDADGLRHHDDRPRPPGAAGFDAARDRGREGRDHQTGRPGGRRPSLRRRPTRSSPPRRVSGGRRSSVRRTSTCRRMSRSRCPGRTSATTRA